MKQTKSNKMQQMTQSVLAAIDLCINFEVLQANACFEVMFNANGYTHHHFPRAWPTGQLEEVCGASDVFSMITEQLERKTINSPSTQFVRRIFIVIVYF